MSGPRGRVCGKDIKIAWGFPRWSMLLYHSVDVHLGSIEVCQHHDVGVGVCVGVRTGHGMTLLDPT
jgi:hypothetical protein